MSTSLPQARAVVLDRWRVVYVVTPKAMCTSLLWAMAGLRDDPIDATRSRSAEVTRALSVHDPACWPGAFLHERSADEVESIAVADSWFRFTLTRHPVDRLWSAWQSKLLLREPAYAVRFGDQPWFPRPVGALDTIAEDFERFVVALGADPELRRADQHWAPQTYLLQTGTFPYTEIGQVERAAATLERLERHLGEHGWHGSLELERHNVSLLPRAAVVREPGLLRRIEEVYADDLESFGYQPAAIGHRPAASASAVAVRALAELAERHERIGDLFRLLHPARPPRRASVSLVSLTGPRPWETMAVPDEVEVVQAPSGPNVAARLQAGIEVSTGDIVVLCRDITAVSPGWPDRIRAALSGPDVGLVGAVLQPADQPDLRLAGFEFTDEVLNRRWIATSDSDVPVPLLPGAFLAIRRRTLTYLGGLDTGLGGDAWYALELCVRAWRCGMSAVVAPSVVVTWQPPEDEDSPGFVPDLLRVAAIHLDAPRFARLLGALRDTPGITRALADLLVSDAGARRGRLEQISLHDTAGLLPAAPFLAEQVAS